MDLVITQHQTPLLESQYLDHARQFYQFSSRKKNQYHSNSIVEIPDTQSSQESHESVTEIPSRFYRQVKYEEIQAYVFVDTTARVPAEDCMYIIFQGPTKRYFR